MAPSRSQPFKTKPKPNSNSGTRLEVPSRRPFYAPSSSTSTGKTCTTVDRNSIPSRSIISATSSTSDLHSAYLTPTILEAQTIGRPSSSPSLPPTKIKTRKNMKDFTGFDTTEDEFENLPLAVRRKVCRAVYYVLPAFTRAWSFQRSGRRWADMSSK